MSNAFSNDQKASAIFASMKVIKEEDGNGKEVPTPFFIIKGKENGQWADKERFKVFTATPYTIELNSYIWNNAPVDTVKMMFIKDNERVQLEFNLDNGLSRSLLNSMLGAESIGELSMSLYVNKEGYPSIGITNDGEKTQWKYKHDEFPVVLKNKKGVVIENEDYIKFLKVMVEGIKKKLPMTLPAAAGAAEERKPDIFERKMQASDDEFSGMTPPEEQESDLPF